MPIQELENNSLAGSLGRASGSSLGTGLGGLLEGLAEGKLKKFEQRNKSRSLESVLGPEISGFVQNLPPETQKAAFQNIGPLLQLKESLSGNKQQQQEQPFGLHSVTPEQREQLKQFIGTPEASKAHSAQELAKIQRFLDETPAQEQQQVAQNQTQMPPQDRAKLIESVFTSPHEKRENRKLEISEKKLDLAEKEDKQKKLKSKEHVQKAYDRVKDILDTGYTGYSLTGLSPEGRKQRSELDTLSEVFISNLIPLLNPKGTISKERFNYIKNLAPNSWDTDAALKGKMEALKDIFELKGSSAEKSNKSTVEMRNADGDIYDIPADMVEEAKKRGLK